MKNIYFITLILSICSLPSCSLDKKAKEFSAFPSYTINLDSVSSAPFRYSSIYSKVKAIVLDNQKVLLNEITRLSSFQDNFFVLDSKAQALYAFNSEGQFIHQIGNLGSGPGEYASCTDFTIDTDKEEIIILDSALKKIFKYKATNGRFIESIHLDNLCDIDRIYYHKKNLYGTKAGFISLSNQSSFMLHQLSATSGKLKRSWLDNNKYNKGWQGEFIRNNLFYPTTNKCLFIMGFMDTIIQIETEQPLPYITLESKGLVTEEDIIPIKEKKDREAFLQMFQYNIKHKKIQNICGFFEHKEQLFFSFQRFSKHFVCHNKRTNETLIYDKEENDILYKESPSNYTFPKFLLADGNGVYYSTPIESIDELRHFIIEKGLGSDKFVNKEILKKLDIDSNPVILFYEFKK